jgi:hypothetical protein
MNHHVIAAEQVLIDRNHWDIPVSVDLRVYLRFSRRMDFQLRRLVRRWAHAAPGESRGLPEEMPATET